MTGEWHLHWQAFATRREVHMVKGAESRRADAVLATGQVLEVQHSPISVEEVAAREAFYGDMIWLFDAREWVGLIRFSRSGFVWRQPALSQLAVTKPLYWDVGEDQIWRVELAPRGTGARGQLLEVIGYADFVARVLGRNENYSDVRRA